MIRIIVAIDQSRGLADDRGIPWQGRIPTDARYFREQTRTGTVLMGFRTYEEFDRPLNGRENFVLARPGGTLRPGFAAVPDLSAFLDEHGDGLVWVIGGSALFERSLPSTDELYLTRLDAEFACTKFFPEFEPEFELASRSTQHVEDHIPFRFEVWRRSPAPGRRNPGHRLP